MIQNLLESDDVDPATQKGETLFPGIDVTGVQGVDVAVPKGRFLSFGRINRNASGPLTSSILGSDPPKTKVDPVISVVQLRKKIWSGESI